MRVLTRFLLIFCILLLQLLTLMHASPSTSYFVVDCERALLFHDNSNLNQGAVVELPEGNGMF
jgi:hypothetical protein